MVSASLVCGSDLSSRIAIAEGCGVGRVVAKGFVELIKA